MYAYKIIESVDFQRISPEIYSIKSGVNIADKSLFYTGYAEWLSELIVDVVSGKLIFVTASNEFETVAYMSFGNHNTTIDVQEIHTISDIEKLEEIVCGLLKYVAANYDCGLKIKYFVFHHKNAKVPKCDFLKLSEMLDDESRYCYLQ